MKELLKDLYNIESVSFIKLSDRVYRVKTNDQYYILKYIDNRNIDTIIEKLKILGINSFVFPILNKENEYVSNYKNILFILFPHLQEEKVSLNDLKVKFFLTELSSLHNKTFYQLKVNETFFKDTYEYIGKKIDDSEERLNKYMEKVEKSDYKSPSEWLFLLNYPLYMESIDKANKSLEKFKEISYTKNSVRMSFTYKSFDYKHIFLKERKIIGIENIEISSPVYDIFYTISTLENVSIDIKSYYTKYFKDFILEDYEKEWLYALLYIPKISFSDNESVNISKISSSLEYIKSSYEIIETLKDIKFN